MPKITDYEPLNPDITTDQSDILGYTTDDQNATTLVENVAGMARSWRPPYILAPVVQQRLENLKNTPLTHIINPMSNYERRFTRFNLFDMYVERIGKEFSKQTFNLFIDDEVQSPKSTKPHMYNYMLKVRPNREQSLTNFLFEFTEKAIRNRNIAIYIDKINYIMVMLPTDFFNEHGQYMDVATQKFKQQFRDTYGFDFKKENCHYSKFTQAGRGQMNYSFYWIDLINLLDSMTPKGVINGQGRIRPNPELGINTQAWNRIAEFQQQLDKTSIAYMGTEEKYQELFTTRANSAETYLNNQLNILELSSGMSADVLKGDFTAETWVNFQNVHIQPLVSFFAQTLTDVLFSREAVLRGSRVEQNLFQPTPYDIGLLNQSTLIYDARFTPNEFRGKIGLSTDDKLLDIPSSNKNMQPISEELFDADRAAQAFTKRKNELKLMLMENDPSISLEDTRKATIGTKGMVEPDGSIMGLADDTTSPQPTQSQPTPPTGGQPLV